MSALLPSDDLAPCPFCGGKAERRHPDQPHGGMVTCVSCGAEAFGPKWDRRSDAALEAIIERLTEAETILSECNDELALIDWISDQIGLSHDEELTRENFAAAWNRRTAPVGGDVLEVSDKMRAQFGEGRPLPEGLTLDDYWATSVGRLSYEWSDKPHRLIFDLIALILHRETLARQPAPSLPTQEDVARVIERLQGYADDPMWAEHAEVPKSLLRAAILALMGQTGDGWQECATEGCEQPATVRFERGGVGSHYCHACYLRIQAIPAPPAKEGR